MNQKILDVDACFISLEMEVKDAERMVVAKPIASRPCSSFGSFSELLAGAINASPPCSYSEMVVAAIRPKTVRFKPVANHGLGGEVVSSQGEVSDTAVRKSSNNVSQQSSKPTVVYKPLAKVVSRTTASLMLNQGNVGVIHQKALAPGQSHFEQEDQAKRDSETHITSSLSQKLKSQMEINHVSELSKMTLHNLEDNQKGLLPTTSGDRLSYDGYNWRKYGQKQVKGSEYPRSYYKCTHPNCPVKKKVERSFDGKIAEIVYNGEHNHSKPQPPKRPSSGTQEQGFVSDEAAQDTSNPLWNNTLNELNERSEGHTENPSEVSLSVCPIYPCKGLDSYDPAASGAFNSGIGTPDHCCGLSGDIEDGSSRGVDADDPEPKYKRRSYYRCTSLKCNVRKHVERASDDPKAFITTYEGKHNHDMPMNRNLNPVASDPDSPAPANKLKRNKLAVGN
ncbi:WRKY transcription factor 44-like isoform X2 [Macadamia integrifolia]|uniref:WRKY transcription factor 44-like isoform X2 n=1 Tax=Macadamia integrifolia TaxID=60698 RepID=UPI001C53412D|nr:WRKY transcription factor 44-like isoform X2 [Macadamia integrifolia]